MTAGNDRAFARYRLCVVNGVFVSDGVGEDGRVRAPRLFVALAESLARETGMRAWAVWPFRSRRIFGPPEFAVMTRRRVRHYARYLAEYVRADLAADPLAADEALAFVVYSGGVPVVQTAATLLRPEFPIASFAFFGPALLPKKVPPDWLGDATCGVVLGDRDWVQGVYPRVPRPWHRTVRPRTLARLRAALPAATCERTLPCDHWPGYFTQPIWPALVGALAEVLVLPSGAVQTPPTTTATVAQSSLAAR